MRPGLKKLDQPDFTASVRAGSPSLMVISEAVVPETYWLPQPPKLDRQSLLSELKTGHRRCGRPTQQSQTYC